MNSQTVAELEHRPFHQKVLRKYGGCLLNVNDLGGQQTPHKDAYASLAPGAAIEYKHEYFNSPNLCLELVANIPYDDACFKRSPEAGTTFDWHECHDNWYAELFSRAKENSERKTSGEKINGPSLGLLNADLSGFGSHVTQYVRVWPTVTTDGIDAAKVYYLNTAVLQEQVGSNRHYWEHRVTHSKHNSMWTCLSVLVPVTSSALKAATIAEYDITAEYSVYDAATRAAKAEKELRAKEYLARILGE